MDPRISELSEEDGTLRFRLSGVNVSIANAIRRIILSDIPCVVFRTFPYEENKVQIETNTTRMNNELLKQRLSCVPIHISDTSTPIQNYVIEAEKHNDGDVIDFLTTGDFKIKDVATQKYLSDAATAAIFPKDPITQDYIDIVRLRPQLSSELLGEKIKFTAELDIGTASEDGGFNVASACTYANTPDPVAIAEELRKLEDDLTKEGLDKDEIEFRKKDWQLLKGQTFFVEDSFDFLVETVGQFSNTDLVFKACHVMLDKLAVIKSQIGSDPSMINDSDTTLPNSFDITLDGSYTTGKALEYVLYRKHYEGIGGQKMLTFCGFRRPHPHIDESIIRLGFTKTIEKASLQELLQSAITDLEAVYQTLAGDFKLDE